METTAALRLPKLLTAYASCCPKVDIELELGPTNTLIASVLERKIEAAFVAGPINQENLATIAVLEEELVLVAGTKVRSHDEVINKLASKREGRVLVFKTGCSYRLRLEGTLAAHGLMHVRRMEFGTLDGIVGCVEAGMGVSLLPRVVAAPKQRTGRVSIHALPEGAGSAQTLLVYRKDSLLTAAFERFLDHTSKAFNLLPQDDAPAREHAPSNPSCKADYSAAAPAAPGRVLTSKTARQNSRTEQLTS